MEEKKEPKIKILVACHKADPNIRQDDIYMPIQVGKALHPELDLGFQCDNTGDNISEKNGSYCELTALYWAWKNLKDIDYIGLCHYRRYFDFKTKQRSVKVLNGQEVGSYDGLNIDLKKIKDDNVIVPYLWSTPRSVWSDFLTNVMSQDLYILYKIIERHHASYLPAFERYLLGNRRTGFNMFILSKSKFDKYCEWLFSILDKMEKLVSFPNYISYKRLYGYLGEILFPVFCMSENLNIKEATLLFISDIDNSKKVPFKQRVKDTLYNISYLLGNIPRKKTLKDPYWEMYLKMDKIMI